VRALDEALPQFDVNEVHSISLGCGPEEAVQRALAAPAAPDRLTTALFRARGLRSGTTIQELFDRTGFETLARSPTEVVFAASGTPWRPSGGLSPFETAKPGTVRVATDFTEMTLDVEVWDLRQLNQLLAQLKDLECVATVRRLYE